MSKCLKISISGLPDSGKTDIAREVKKILGMKRDVELLDAFSQNPFDIKRKDEFKSHFYSMTNQINQENAKVDCNPDLLICDKSILDHMVFWKKKIDNEEENELIRKRDELMEKIFDYWIDSYDIFFYIVRDIEELIKNKYIENQKDDFIDYLKQLDKRYKSVAESRGIECNEIQNNNSIEESAQKFVEILKEKGLLE